MSENISNLDDFLPRTFQQTRELSEVGIPIETASEYGLLIGHNRTDGTFKTSDQLRAEYVHLTDGLVYKMTEGVEVTDPQTGEKETKIPDVVIWLDKSARPVAWLTSELWPELAADEDGNVPKMPDFRFLNIDREQWVNMIDPEGVGRVDIDLVDPSIIRSLRSVFVEPTELKHGLTQSIDEASTELDGKTVLIVDEVRASGKTLEIAEKFIKRAFPKAKVGSAHWMKGVAKVGQAIGNADLPVWYKERDERGRGVANRNEQKSRLSHSSRQRLGGWFLSTVMVEPDPTSIQLRREMKQLGQDVRNHKILVVPSLEREMDDFDERALRYNKLANLEEFKASKNELDSSR